MKLEDYDLDPSVVVLSLLVATWSEDNDDAFLWSANGCCLCEKELHEGEQGVVWGEPFGTMVALKTYCSEKHAEEALDHYADKQGIEHYYIATHR